MKLNVLIFPSSTEIGLEIYHSLKDLKEFNLFGAGMSDGGNSALLLENFRTLPIVTSPTCLKELNQTIEDFKIDYIFPAHDDVIIELSKIKQQLKCKIAIPSHKTCEITRYKSLTYQLLKNDILTPQIHNETNKLPLPLFAKPDRGQGAQGAFKIKSEEELAQHSMNKNLIITEFLPGKEYTIDCLSDSKGLVFCAGRERSVIRNGIAVRTSIVENTNFEKMAKIIGKKLEMKGAWFFQVKENQEGELTLLEVAPRIAGSMSLNRSRGVNFAALTLWIHEGNKVNVLLNKGPNKVDRALTNRFFNSVTYDKAYIDYDDTLLIDGKINTKLISLIYQMHNENKKVILITRHAGNLKESLKKYRLENLFHEVIHILDDTKKSNHMTDNAIFIDDSFKERLEVSEKDIITFDLSMIDSLVNERV